MVVKVLVSNTELALGLGTVNRLVFHVNSLTISKNAFGLSPIFQLITNRYSNLFLVNLDAQIRPRGLYKVVSYQA